MQSGSSSSKRSFGTPFVINMEKERDRIAKGTSYSEPLTA